MDPSELTQRGQRTRSALLSAARIIFERDGFHAARITDIADAASVAHGTFYTYFDSKEAVFLDLLQDLQEDMLGWHNKTKSDTNLDPVARLERSNRQYLESYRANGRLIGIWEEIATFNEEAAAKFDEGRAVFVKRSQAQIQRLQKEGLVDPEIDPRYAAQALTGMVSRFAWAWISGGERFEFEAAVKQLTRLWANAIGLTTALQPSAPAAKNGRRRTRTG